MLDIPGVQVVTELGRGARGVVYRGRARDRDVAVKVPKLSRAEDAVAFRREGALLASVSHPGLARVYEVGSSGPTSYIISEFIDGTTLAEELRLGALPASRVELLGLTLAGALNEVHRRNLVHRDIKPHNIIWGSSGPKLIDFGLAAWESLNVTPDGEFAGTLLYASPEQTGMLKRPVDGRSDLYSLGVVLFECLVGRPPFWGEPADLIRQHAVVPAPSVHEFNPRIPAALSAIVARLLAKDPDDRYRSAYALWQDFHQLGALERGEAPVHIPAWVNPERPLVGRTQDLSSLREAWLPTTVGHGGAALVVGNAGAGKSRLIREFLRSLPGPPAILPSKCDQESGQPFGAINEALTSGAFDALVRAAPEASRLATKLVISEAPEQAHALSYLIPVYKEMIQEGNQAAGDFLLNIHESLCRWLAEFARLQGGMVVVLEDVQWADEGMLQFLLHLGPHLADSPLFLVLSAREWEGPLRVLEGGLGGSVRARVQVRPLDAAETGRFLESYLGAPSMPEICAWIYRQSQGNAFAIEQYLRACLDQAALQPNWGEWVADMTALRALNLPQDIFELIRQRLLTLGGETMGVLRTAALLGGQFEEKLLAQLFGWEAVQMLRDSLAQAVAQGALERRGDGHYRFAHDRIRESFLTHWDAAELAAEHLRIAECLENETPVRVENIYACARHFIAGNGPGPKVFRSCWQAAQWARRQCAFDSAYEFLQQCLRHAPEDKRYSVLDALAEACEMTGRVEQAFNYLGEALELDIDPLNKARCHLRRCQMGLQNPEWGAGGRELGQAFREIGADAPAGGRASLLSAARNYLGYLSGRRFSARPASEDVTVLAQLYDQTTVVGYYRGDIPRTLESVAVGLRLSLTLGATRETVRSLCLMSFVMAIGHLHRLSDYYLGVAEQKARDLMDPVSLRRVKAFRGIAYFQRNRIQESLDIMWDSLFAEGPRLLMSDYSIVLGALAWAQMLRGDFNKVLDVLERARQMFTITDRPLPAEIRLLECYQVVARSAFERVVDFTPFALETRSAWQDLSLPGCHLIALLFRGEWGAAADAPLASIEGALAPDLPMHMKHALVARAYIWLYRAQNSEGRGPALQTFGKALLDLTVSSRQYLLSGHAVLLRAAWLRLKKQFAAARLSLEKAQKIAEHLDSPWLYLEILCERSRLLADQGQIPASRSAAQLALGLAQREGWNERARHIAREASLPWGRSLADTENTRGGASGLIQRRQLEALRELSLASAKVFDPARLAHLVLGQVIQLMGAQRALLLLFQGDCLQVLAARTAEGPMEGSQVGYSRTVVDTVISQRRSVIVNGAQEGLQLGSHSVVAQDLRSILVSPLRLRDALMGVIYLDNSATRGLFDEDDQELLEAMASHVAVGLESARALQIEFQLKVERGHRQVAEKLRDFATQLSMCGSLEEILTLLRITISQETGLEDFCAVLPEPEGIRVLMGELRQRQPLVEQAMSEQRLVQAEETMVVPCTGRSGPVALLCLSGPAEQHSERAREFIETVARQSALAMDQVLLVRQLIEIATTDALTGVSNRRHFLDLCERELAKARRYKTPLSLIIMDIDHFKKFNDTYGHDVGDDVLRTVAQALKHELRTEDILARYGGEEFVVLLPETPLADALAVAAERLRKRIETTPLETVHGSLKITISLGVATFSETRNDIRTILKRADEGLYAAKQRGRNQSVALGDDE